MASQAWHVCTHVTCVWVVLKVDSQLVLCLRLTSQVLRADVCRRGRKPLFVVCGTIMAAMQIATGILTALTFTGTKIPQTAGDIMIVFICIFVAMFAASWGPLGWLVCPPSSPNLDMGTDRDSGLAWHMC